jgi:hydroxymethylbilane synthase
VAGERTLIAGTRGSRLALRQTELALEALRAKYPTLTFEVRQIRTEGDRSQAPLTQIGGQGVFVKELERALARGEIDFVVHSLKDVPNDLGAGLALAAVLERADPRDALVTRAGARLADLPAGARIGTGSARRAVQLRLLRPDVEPVDIRGNVDTRVRKVDDGEFDAAVLALAGLERLGLLDRASEIFEPEVMVPAVGQGTLALEARADDAEVIELLAAIEHRDSRLACETERAFLARLGGGCRLPFGAIATVHGDLLHARGFISNERGTRMAGSVAAGNASDPATVGLCLADALLAQEVEAGR